MQNQPVSFKKVKPTVVVLGILGFCAWCFYLVEPWAVTFVDDGPYYSEEYNGKRDQLSIYSEIPLNRFGRSVYVLESRLTDHENSSVLVLKNWSGQVRWKRVPLKPDGPLGPIKLTRQSLVWYGGWRIGMKPAGQESGVLYLGPLGGLRFFNHSW